MNDCKLTPFSASEPGGRRRSSFESETFRAWSRRKRRFESRAGSMLAKIGICMAVLLGVVLLQAWVLRGDTGEPAVAADAEPSGQNDGEEDVLGRLRFVSAGGVKSVFKVSQRWDLPVISAKSARTEQEDTLLCITASPGAEVRTCAGGEVRALGTDEALGDYVRVSHGNDLESVYYHLNDIQVEKGQPLQARDTLGAVPADGKLYVAVLEAGERLNPASYLDTGNLL